MPFYLRKSVRVGPIRFNLSKSGIGVSTGIPGLRVGTGPRGTYVHMGRGGLYYRQTLSSPTHRHRHADRPVQESLTEHPHTHGPMSRVTSGCITEMADINSAALLAEIEQKRKRIVWWPFVFVLSLIVGAILFFWQASIWLAIPCAVLFLVATVFVHQYDQLKKSVVLMYDLDGPCLDAYQELFAASNEMARCGAVWHITAQGDVYDPKYHAGAGQIINRRRLSIGHRNPPYVKTNLSVPFLPFGKNSLYLLPDRILVYAQNGVGAVGYNELILSANPTRFIENGAVPRDANVVDRTWRYVNKGGGPDRRFNNNHEIPICEYEELQITSDTGIREIIQLSRLGTSSGLELAISNIVNTTRDAEIAEHNRKKLEMDRERQQMIEAEKQAAEQKKRKLADAKPTAKMLHDALFDILCCIMVADGRASTSEKSMIADIMAKVNSGWSDDECSLQIQSFINRVQEHGYSVILRRSMNRLPIFKNAGRENVVHRCVNLVANANGKLTEREKDLCDRISNLMRTGTSDDT